MEKDCLICQEDPKYLKFLNCGSVKEKHKLCFDCVEKIATTVPNSADRAIECPLCRKKTILPNGDATKLQTKFIARLICEDCSVEKDIEEQWWCKICEKTICSKCAMVEHRQHDCSCLENHDVAKEILLFLNNRLNGHCELVKKVKMFCNHLESYLLKKIEPDINYSSLMKNIEGHFGDLKLLKDDKKVGSKISHVEKKLKLVIDLAKSTKSELADVETALTNLPENEISLKFPDMIDLLLLFDASFAIDGPFTVNDEFSSWISLMQPQLVRNKLVYDHVQKIPGIAPSAWHVNFSRDINGGICYGNGKHVWYFSEQDGKLKLEKNDKFLLTNGLLSTNQAICMLQIVYSETRDSFFITQQAGEEHKTVIFLEFSLCQRVSHVLTAPDLPDMNIKGTTFYPLPGVLHDGSLILLISDGIDIYIFFKIFKQNVYQEWVKVFQNVEPSKISANIVLENLTQLRTHYFTDDKEMLIVSGTTSMYCFMIFKKSIQFIKVLKNVFEKNMFYCFANNSSVFIADLDRSILKEINLETHAINERKFEDENMNKIEGMDNAPILAVACSQDFFYVMKSYTISHEFCKHLVFIYKIM